MQLIFKEIEENLKKRNVKTLDLTPNIFTLNPSSQVSYDKNLKPNGSCLRQQWFEKTSQDKTNHSSANIILAQDLGNYWENWFINELRILDLLVDNQILATDRKNLVKGFVDVLTRNKAGELELGEIKTYDGSNYFKSQSILGTKSKAPEPMLSHLLQIFRYLLIYEKQVVAGNIYYIDKSCSAWYKNYQFRVTIFEHKNVKYPQVECIWYDEYYNKIYDNISDLNIYKAEQDLLKHIKDSTIPLPSYIPLYNEEQVEDKYANNLIDKTSYEKYKKDPVKNYLGDYQCSYCSYRYLCLQLNE